MSAKKKKKKGDLAHNAHAPFRGGELGDDVVVVGSHGHGSCMFHTILRACWNVRVPPRPMRDREAKRKSGFVPLHTLLGVKEKDYTVLSDKRTLELGKKFRRMLQGEGEFCDHFEDMLADIAAEEGTSTLVSTQASSCPIVKKKIGNVRLWADTKSISYLCWRLKISVYFYDDLGGDPYCGITRTARNKTGKAVGPAYENVVLVNWHSHRHFESIARHQKGTYTFHFTRDELKKGTDPLLAFFVKRYNKCSRTHAVIMGY